MTLVLQHALLLNVSVYIVYSSSGQYQLNLPNGNMITAISSLNLLHIWRKHVLGCLDVDDEFVYVLPNQYANAVRMLTLHDNMVSNINPNWFIYFPIELNFLVGQTFVEMEYLFTIYLYIIKWHSIQMLLDQIFI